MRLAVLTNDYPPQSRGGAGVIAEIQVRELLRRGHEVRVFTSVPEWTKSSLFIRLFHHLADLKANRKLVAEIIEWKPQILLTHNLTGCGIGTPRMLKRHGIPWVHVLHDVQLVEPSGRIVQGESFNPFLFVWRWKWSLVRRWALGNPTVVISPTEWLLKFHRKWGFFWSSKTKVIGNPVEMGSTDGSPTSPRRLLGDDRGEEGRERSILYVGRVDRDKGIGVLINAWRLLGPDAPRLSIVGDGTERVSLEAKKDARITVYGRQPIYRILDMMQEHSVLAVPSLLLENQPTVILEGLAAGCNIVASDVGGIPETLDGSPYSSARGAAGWIVKAGDIPALAAGLKSAIEDADPAAREEREKNRERVLARHRVDVVVADLESALKSNL